jgi:hypothetical protein
VVASLLAKRPCALRHAIVATWLNATGEPTSVAECGQPQPRCARRPGRSRCLSTAGVRRLGRGRSGWSCRLQLTTLTRPRRAVRQARIRVRETCQSLTPPRRAVPGAAVRPAIPDTYAAPRRHSLTWMRRRSGQS